MNTNTQNTCYFEEPETFTVENFEDLELRPSSNYLKVGGMADCLGLAMPPVVVTEQCYMITVNLPTKENYKLNKSTRRQWRDYKPSEQHKILSRVVHLMNNNRMYECYFEYTKEVNLHAHILIWTTDDRKSVYCDFMRFFGIKGSNRYAIHITSVTDLDGVRSYLTGKTTKTYQTSPFNPIIKKPIEDFN